MLHGGEVLFCTDKLEQLQTLKRRCNDIRRSVVRIFYEEMLIPDFRADVLPLSSSSGRCGNWWT
jgi:hypothetical protein